MLAQRLRFVFYLTFFLTLLVIDYNSGNGLVNMFQKISSEIECLAREALKNEPPSFNISMEPINLPKLMIEVFIFTLTFMILKKYQKMRGKDRVDELLHESREALQQTNDYLEKWKLKQVPTKYNYFEMLPSDLSPLKLEIPVLNMAIIETRNSARNQTERGDADDSINISDSIVFSITSLIDDDDDEVSNNFVKERNDEQWTDDLRSLFRNPADEELLAND